MAFKKRQTKKSGFRKRGVKRRSTIRKRVNRSGPTSSKQRRIMPDRSFVTLEYVTGTQAINLVSTGPSLPAVIDGTGMVNFADSYSPTSPEFQQFVLMTNYQLTGATVQPVFSGRFLPGNSLKLDAVAQQTYFSDAYKQLSPTGITEWAKFYDKYIVHGSSVEVTLVGASVPGQLVVLPVTLSTAYDLQSYGYPSEDMRRLLQFAALPEDQPYARFKLVSAAGGMDKIIVRNKMLTKKLYDKKDLRDDDANFGRTKDPSTGFVADPAANFWCWFIAFVPVNTVTQVESNHDIVCSVQVKIKYFVEMTDRANPEFATASTTVLAAQ